MSYEHKTAKIDNAEALATFVHELRQDLLTNPDEWENADLASFLDAIGAWLADAEGYFHNHQQEPPPAETWQTLASILAAGKIYE